MLALYFKPLTIALEDLTHLHLKKSHSGVETLYIFLLMHTSQTHEDKAQRDNSLLYRKKVPQEPEQVFWGKNLFLVNSAGVDLGVMLRLSESPMPCWEGLGDNTISVWHNVWSNWEELIIQQARMNEKKKDVIHISNPWKPRIVTLCTIAA